MDRYQVQLDMWQVEYAKFLCEKYGFNFSAVVRACMCLGIVAITEALHPSKYKADINAKRIAGMLHRDSKLFKKNIKIKSFQEMLMHEARKAIEVRLQNEGGEKHLKKLTEI